jgi:hypothetical protein
VANDSWVGRLDDTMLITVGSEHFVVEVPATADSVEELLRLVPPSDTVTQEFVSRRGLGDVAAALVETGLLLDARLAAPSGDQVSFTAALVAALRCAGISASGLADPPDSSEPEVLLHVAVDGGDDIPSMREAVCWGSY